MGVPTRTLTGQIPWPVLLLAGGADCGKTYTAYEASNSDLVNRSFLLAYGEDIHEDYLPIAPKLEVVDHDGSVQDFMTMLKAASAEPRGEDGRPNLLIVDGAGRLWQALSNQAQYAARLRVAKKANRQNPKVGEKGDVGEEATIGRDLWNSATDRWNDFLDVLKRHDGPVIVTSLLREVSDTDARGNPTKDRVWVIDGQQRFRSEVGAMVCIPEYRTFYVTRVKSLKMEPSSRKLGESFIPRNLWQGDFTVDALWQRLGLTSAATASTHAFIEREPGNASGVFTGPELKQAVTDAVNRDKGNAVGWNPIVSLHELTDEITEAGLAGIRVETPDGPVNGLEYVQRLIAHYASQGCPDPRAIQRADAPAAAAASDTRPVANAPQGDAPRANAPQGDAPRANAPQGDAPANAPQVPAAKAAADAQAVADQARLNAGEDRMLRAILSELEWQAGVLGVSVEEHHALILAGKQGAKDLGEIPFPAVRRFAVAQRPRVIAALREQGHEALAHAYAAVAPTKIAPAGTLTGAADKAREQDLVGAG